MVIWTQFQIPGIYTHSYPFIPLKKKDNMVDGSWVYSNFIVTERPGCNKSTWLEQMVVILPKGEAWAQLAAHKS